jgi:hypothetical protein
MQTALSSREFRCTFAGYLGRGLPRMDGGLSSALAPIQEHFVGTTP